MSKGLPVGYSVGAFNEQRILPDFFLKHIVSLTGLLPVGVHFAKPPGYCR